MFSKEEAPAFRSPPNLGFFAAGISSVKSSSLPCLSNFGSPTTIFFGPVAFFVFGGGKVGPLEDVTERLTGGERASLFDDPGAPLVFAGTDDDLGERDDSSSLSLP